MKEKERKEQEDGEEPSRGIVTMENIPGFTPQFNKIARKHGFKVANRTENRVKDLIGNAKTPLEGKNTDTVYRIPSRCKKHS